MAEQMLFPVFQVPDLVTESIPEEETYKRSVYWDIDAGDFKRDGAHRLLASDGQDTYIQWCCKVTRTERYAHLAYPDSIGTEMKEAMGQPTDRAVESMLARTISEALLVNPRTEYVRDFSFTWHGDTVICRFTVKGKEWDEFRIKTSVLPEEVITNDS